MITEKFPGRCQQPVRICFGFRDSNLAGPEGAHWGLGWPGLTSVLFLEQFDEGFQIFLRTEYLLIRFLAPGGNTCLEDFVDHLVRALRTFGLHELIEQVLRNPHRVDRCRSIRVRFQVFLNAFEDSEIEVFFLELFFVHGVSLPCVLDYSRHLYSSQREKPFTNRSVFTVFITLQKNKID
jgi:hypothetical protein